MKSWKKRWKEELDAITPTLRDDVKNAPISATDMENNGGNTAALSLTKRKLIPVIAAITALLICAIILCVCLIKPSKTYNEFLFTLEINPTVTMSADENGIVTGVIASDSDADIILSDEKVRNAIKGKHIDEAVTYYTDHAARLGYIDLEKKGSAVRISGLGNVEFLGEARKALETYFTARGVFAVVVAESVNREEFSLRSGISADLSAEDITKYIKDSSVLFSDRKAENSDLQDLQFLYNELVVADKLLDYVDNSLSQNLERIIQNAEDIENLSQLYFEIFNHADNPMKPIGDYWTVKQLHGSDLSGEFAELMSEMETALEKYKADYDVDIMNITQLQSAVNSYLKIPANTLAALLENLSFEKFEELSSDLTAILEITGLVTSDFAEYLQAPESLDEYVSKMSALINEEYKSRLDTFESLYNKYRQPIEVSDYEAYIESIIRQYGSLDDYWQAIKN